LFQPHFRTQNRFALLLEMLYSPRPPMQTYLVSR